MLNKFATFLLVSTALSPILGAVAVNQISLERPYHNWLPWVTAAIALTLICWGLLKYAAENVQVESFTIQEFENGDKEVLAFLLAYLLPFLSAKDMAFTGNWVTGTYIIVIIFWVIAHAGAMHFNPVMGLLGYHFYTAKDRHGISYLLISKKQLQRKGTTIPVVKLAHNIYLHKDNANA